MSSTSKLYPPADISKQTVLVTGAERQISCAPSWKLPVEHDRSTICAGASSGIGEACAWRFAEAGTRLLTFRARIGRCNPHINKQFMAHLCRLQARADCPENRQAGEAGQGFA